MITIKNLYKNYKKIEALRGLSVTIPKGSVYGLLGPNGSGKTTTLGLITKILKPDTGSITILGKDIKEYYTVSDKIGALLQDTDLYVHRTVYDNLKYFAKLDHVSEGRVNEVLQMVKMESKKDAKYGTLSHGQKKLIQFCQAMLKDPELLILDEPTAGFDPKNILLMTNIISSFKGKTILLTSNHLDIVKKVCSHVAIINNGKIGYEGKINSKANLEKLYMKIVK
tara:strand:- start:1036 stop:1710 length:675 start_codon:yes stop_codon:yes gene_type:complete